MFLELEAGRLLRSRDHGTFTATSRLIIPLPYLYFHLSNMNNHNDMQHNSQLHSIKKRHPGKRQRARAQKRQHLTEYNLLPVDHFDLLIITISSG